MDKCTDFLRQYWYSLFVTNGSDRYGWLYVNFNNYRDLFTGPNENTSDDCALWRLERESSNSDFYYLIAKCMDGSGQRAVKAWPAPCFGCSKYALTYNTNTVPPTRDVLFKFVNGRWVGFVNRSDMHYIALTDSQLFLFGQQNQDTVSFNTYGDPGDPLIGSIIYNNLNASCKTILDRRCNNAIGIDDICLSYLNSEGQMDNYCSNYVLHNKKCERDYCKQNCLAKLGVICKEPKNYNNPTCGCFLPPTVYKSFQNDILSKLEVPGGISGDIRCYFPNCTSSDMFSKAVTSKCPGTNINISKCFQNLNIDNSGKVTGNININQNADCKSTVSVKDEMVVINDRQVVIAVVLLTLALVIVLYTYN
jgi:hypothetical protein